jgi:RNA polymerase sigma factor (sigma-70 family)
VEWEAFLRKILENTLADEVRRLTRLPHDVFKEQSLHHAVEQTSCQLEAFAAKHTSPTEHARRAELFRLLVDSLESLAPDERSALELRYLQTPPWSLPQIARQLNRPSSKAVAGLLARGLEKLRELLSAYPGESHD